jgi:hypothetical protein
MIKFNEIISNERTQYLAFLGISLFVATLTGILYLQNAPLFQVFIGRIKSPLFWPDF